MKYQAAGSELSETDDRFMRKGGSGKNSDSLRRIDLVMIVQAAPTILLVPLIGRLLK
jgi:hypothetical protein